jgi:hypothetical protein
MHAGCAFLLVHFASFQLKGEWQAWLFITNPDPGWLVQVGADPWTLRKQIAGTDPAAIG